MSQLSKLKSKKLVRGLPDIKFEKDMLCDACAKGKQTKTHFSPKDIVNTSRCLELLHIDLFGPTRTASLNGKHYCLVIVDDYTRYSWVMFLAVKSDALKSLVSLVTKLVNQFDCKVKQIRSDHGREFENARFEEFCTLRGIHHNFSSPRTPQQNGVVERKNRSLQELARTMLCETNLPKHFWAEAINTACHVLNRLSIRSILKKTPYELLFGKQPNVSHFHSFGCKCFIHNNGKDNLGKIDAKSDEGIFLGYSSNSRAY